MSEQSPGLVLVAAMARNRVIGRGGGMPWHLPADLKHFKALTMGHPVLMGRRTFESIGKPLPGRQNLVVSRSLDPVPAGIERVDDIDAALARADGGAIMVIGGGQIYRQLLPCADRLELTLIDATVEGDTHFPEWDPADWRLTQMATQPADQANPYRLTFCTFERIAG